MTFASKTELPCDCGSLAHAAREPALPIEFDPRLNEFNFLYATGKMRIYHCPFCGGKAPESLRRNLFVQIPRAEADRLFRLTDGLKTVAEVLEALGPPDRDSPRGVVVSEPDSADQPPRTVARRTLVY